MKLSKTEIQKDYIITEVGVPLDLKYRFYDLGIVEGGKIRRIRESPLGDPVAYLVKGAVIAVRNRDADMIEVEGK